VAEYRIVIVRESADRIFIAAHKEINRSEQTKTVPPVIDVIAEPILALAGLTDRATAPGVASQRQM
jgi:hypothetical protein